MKLDKERRKLALEEEGEEVQDKEEDEEEGDVDV